ncbi:unnamed protein product [Caenorhabditis auriculariae]|uniref:Uncharacterized protein n=1 Tax=Caenorhabditis auriculariae TaxID=2777116 RepID=A0A8S1GS42_9PELO|nr:unnamed protein product [Caenorhabditis auriculariae]
MSAISQQETRIDGVPRGAPAGEEQSMQTAAPRGARHQTPKKVCQRTPAERAIRQETKDGTLRSALSNMVKNVSTAPCGVHYINAPALTKASSHSQPTLLLLKPNVQPQLRLLRRRRDDSGGGEIHRGSHEAPRSSTRQTETASSETERKSSTTATVTKAVAHSTTAATAAESITSTRILGPGPTRKRARRFSDTIEELFSSPFQRLKSSPSVPDEHVPSEKASRKRRKSSPHITPKFETADSCWVKVHAVDRRRHLMRQEACTICLRRHRGACKTRTRCRYCDSDEHNSSLCSEPILEFEDIRT